jgi:membrane protein required for colicin V production
VLAQWLALDAARYLPMDGASAVMRYAAGFVLVFLVVVLLGSLLAVVVKKLTMAVGLRPVDRALGAVFGSVRGVLLLLVATVLVDMTPMKSDPAWQASVGAEVAVAVLRGLKPALPSELNKFLPA